MKLCFTILLCLSLCLACAGCIGGGEPREPVITITDMGISTAANTELDVNARNPWDLTVAEDTLYAAVGDYGANSGPTAIWKTAVSAAQWESSALLEQEAFCRFVAANGNVLAIGADPVGRPAYAEVYALQEGTWETFAQIKAALHVFDAAYYQDAYFFGVGHENNDPPVVRYSPATEAYTNVPFYKNGTDVMEALKQSKESYYTRTYDLFPVGDRLFCSLTCNYESGKTTLEFFWYCNGRFEFCQAFKGAGMQMNKPIKNQVILNGDAVVGDTCYLSLGNLYRTKDFVTFEPVSVPEGACVTDLLADTSGGGEVLYVLASQKGEETYKNTIYRLENDALTALVTFDHAGSALSFTKQGNTYFVGLGGEGLQLPDTGRILKITIEYV